MVNHEPECGYTGPPLPDVPKLDARDVSWVYLSSYYDGALSGMATIPPGITVWAECYEQCADPTCGGRKYKLIRLDPEVYAEERRREELFRAHVGNHWEYEAGHHRPGRPRPPEMHSQFYNDPSIRQPLEYTGTVIGWFET